MLSFHNDSAIKQKYLSRVIEHREADRIIQRIGWENGKGCAVGCTLENYNHDQYPIELGLPTWLAHIEDMIFEGLSKERAILWPEDFLKAINVGANLEPVRHRLAILRMDRLIALQQSLLGKNETLDTVINDVVVAIKLIKSCHEAELSKTYCDWSAAESAAWSSWSAARSAAESARSAASAESERSAYSARSAAYSAASAAYSAARSARWSAYSGARAAAESAASGAYSARSAAWSAGYSAAYSAAKPVYLAAESAESAAWQIEAEDLLRLLSECK